MNRTARTALLAALMVQSLVAIQPASGQGTIAATAATSERFAASASATRDFEGLGDGADAGGTPAVSPGTRIERDVAYGADPAQRLDVYLPQRTASAPVVLMVHGGAWMIGDKAYANVVANKAAHWLPKGVVFISVNYRMAPKADPLEQARDVARALAFAQSKAPSWGADPKRFVLIGHSSGAHLVALLAADPAIASREGAAPWLATVALDSAALDLVQIMQGQHMRFYDRIFKSDPAAWREASPLYRLKGAPSPMLMVCSSLRSDSCPQARAFADKVGATGGRATVVPVALAHGEINQQLGLPSAYTGAVDAFLQTVGVP